ncbi:unnamed protein product [Closterium sp. NIES-54]
MHALTHLHDESSSFERAIWRGGAKRYLTDIPFALPSSPPSSPQLSSPALCFPSPSLFPFPFPLPSSPALCFPSPSLFPFPFPLPSSPALCFPSPSLFPFPFPLPSSPSPYAQPQPQTTQTHLHAKPSLEPKTPQTHLHAKPSLERAICSIGEAQRRCPLLSRLKRATPFLPPCASISTPSPAPAAAQIHVSRVINIQIPGKPGDGAG